MKPLKLSQIKITTESWGMFYAEYKSLWAWGFNENRAKKRIVDLYNA